MERHKCKLCLKSFANGRALGGHMRSHMLNLLIPPKPEQELIATGQEEETNEQQSAASPSFSSSSEEGEKEACYGLRENPKRSVRLVDPEFSFAVIDAGSVVDLQDRESETESSKNPTPRRSKRTTRKFLLDHQFNDNNTKKVKVGKFSKSESWAEPAEPVLSSSISDTTTEEDVAFCLMMLSRDNKWKEKAQQQHQQQQEFDDEDEEEEEEEEEEEAEETDESEEFKSCKNTTTSTRSNKGKYKCETCNKVFKSYQALGGHRASHKKLLNNNVGCYTTTISTSTATIANKVANFEQPREIKNVGASSSSNPEKKIHKCPHCFRVFSSGQALGGHKRSHVIGVAAAATTTTTTVITPAARSNYSRNFGDNNLNLIDLNLPAPVDDDDVSQIELSAVSDAEFVKQIFMW